MGGVKQTSNCVTGQRVAPHVAETSDGGVVGVDNAEDDDAFFGPGEVIPPITEDKALESTFNMSLASPSPSDAILVAPPVSPKTHPVYHTQTDIAHPVVISER